MSGPNYPELENRQALAEHLRRLYPQLSDRDARIKLAASVRTGLFGFYRAYVGYFYDLLRRGRCDPAFPDFQGMDMIEGWCVGDGHPENFGIVHCGPDRHGADLVFTMNDPDDGSPGPLFADLLRFLTGVRLFDPDFSLEPVVNAYRQGLDGDGVLSPVVVRERSLARAHPERPDQLFRRTDKGNLKLRRRVKTIFRVKKRIKPKLAKRLAQGIGELVGDSYALCRIWSLKKRAGGSAGRRRYWVLLTPRAHKNACAKKFHKKSLVLDLKTLARSGMSALNCPREDASGMLACSDAPEILMNRVWETLDLERGMNIGRYCDVVRFDGLPPMVVRARWAGNRSLQLDSNRFTRREKAQLLKDEAKALGRIHRKSLPQGSRYPAHVFVLRAAQIDAAQQMEVLFRQAFQLLDQPPMTADPSAPED